MTARYDSAQWHLQEKAATPFSADGKYGKEMYITIQNPCWCVAPTLALEALCCPRWITIINFCWCVHWPLL